MIKPPPIVDCGSAERALLAGDYPAMLTVNHAGQRILPHVSYGTDGVEAACQLQYSHHQRLVGC